MEEAVGLKICHSPNKVRIIKYFHFVSIQMLGSVV